MGADSSTLRCVSLMILLLSLKLTLLFNEFRDSTASNVTVTAGVTRIDGVANVILNVKKKCKNRMLFKETKKQALELIGHPKYDRLTMENDIALVNVRFFPIYYSSLITHPKCHFEKSDLELSWKIHLTTPMMSHPSVYRLGPNRYPEMVKRS